MTKRAGRYLVLMKRRCELELLAPSIVLPSQWRAIRKVSPGVHRLHVAVLAGAVHEARTYQKTNRPLPLDLRAWFLEGPAQITFREACNVVGLSPDAVRRAIGLQPSVRSAA